MTNRLRRIGIVAMAVLLYSQFSLAQDSAQTPVGRFLTLESPLNDNSLGLVRRVGLELQSLVEQEDRPVYLIIELTPGNSEFHHAWALAEFLTSGDVANVNTVAWVPKSLSGYPILPVLACKEIILTPEATIGDMGRGKAVPEAQRKIVQTIIDARRNSRVTPVLAEAMMNPDATLEKVGIHGEGDAVETQLVTKPALKSLIESGAVVSNQKTLKEPGAPWSISGKNALNEQILVSQLANSRKEIADLFKVPTDSVRELITPDEITNVAYIELHDDIDPAFHAFAVSQIDRAVAAGAKTIIFEIDTPGGMVDVCMDLSSHFVRLNEAGIQTIAYIPNEAISGGAILAAGCAEIYMHPDAVIGDAIPIHLTMGGGFVHADPKILSVLAEHMRMLARKNDRPSAVLEGFCDPKLEVFQVTNKQTGRVWFMSKDEIEHAGDQWIQGPRIPESRPEVAIFINGERAHELKIAAPPVQDVSELKERLGIPLDMKFAVAQRSWLDNLVFYLNNEYVTGMLFFLAIVCIYIEMATMTGFFGIVAAAAFGVFFWSRMLGGTASSLEIVAFALGLGCLALEIFVIPGFGVFGVSGILMIIGSLVMASVSFSGLGMRYDIGQMLNALGPFAASMVGVIIFASVLSRYLPNIPVLNSMVLAPPNMPSSPDEPRLQMQSVVAHSDLVGAVGKAISVLRPAGKAQVNGQLYDVVSNGPYIQDGATIKVVQVSGNRIVVCEDVIV